MIFSYIGRLGSFLIFFFFGGGGGKNFEFQYFRGFQKNENIFGFEDFVNIVWGHHKIGLYLGVISMHFSVFFKVRLLKNLILFGGA